MPTVNKTLVLNDDVMRGLDSAQSKYGVPMVTMILNRFFVMSGMFPGIPIGVQFGTYQIRGIWQRGVKYTQYVSWEDKIDEFWKIKICLN